MASPGFLPSIESAENCGDCAFSCPQSRVYMYVFPFLYWKVLHAQTTTAQFILTVQCIEFVCEVNPGLGLILFICMHIFLSIPITQPDYLPLIIYSVQYLPFLIASWIEEPVVRMAMAGTLP